MRAPSKPKAMHPLAARATDNSSNSPLKIEKSSTGDPSLRPQYSVPVITW